METFHIAADDNWGMIWKNGVCIHAGQFPDGDGVAVADTLAVAANSFLAECNWSDLIEAKPETPGAAVALIKAEWHPRAPRFSTYML